MILNHARADRALYLRRKISGEPRRQRFPSLRLLVTQARSSDMETENYERGESSGFISGFYYIGCRAARRCGRTRAAETRAI